MLHLGFNELTVPSVGQDRSRMNGDEETGLVTPNKTRRRADIFLLFCRILNVITMLCAALCMLAQAMAFGVGPPLAQVSPLTLETETEHVYDINRA